MTAKFIPLNTKVAIQIGPDGQPAENLNGWIVECVRERTPERPRLYRVDLRDSSFPQYQPSTEYMLFEDEFDIVELPEKEPWIQ